MILDRVVSARERPSTRPFPRPDSRGLAARLLERDLELCRRATRLQRSAPLLALLRFASRAGDGPCWFALAAGLVVTLGFAGLPIVAKLSAAGVLASLAARGVKGWVGRLRPFENDPTIVRAGEPLDRWSFPSGHTLHAVAFNLVLVPDLPGLALALAPWTLAIALSRVVLGLHFPSDVAGGAALGGLAAALVLFFV